MVVFGEKEQDRLARFYGGLKPMERVKIHELHQSLIYANRKQREKGPVFYRDLFMLALQQYASALKKKTADRRIHAEMAKQIDSIKATRKAAKKARQSPNDSFIRKHLSEITQLREELEMSWREIQKHIKKRYRRGISHVYISVVYKRYHVERIPPARNNMERST